MNCKIINHEKLRKTLYKLKGIERKKHHHLLHHLHKKHRLSKQTLFYIKEYGPHSHIAKTILKESFKILLFASIISSIGGFSLEKIKLLFVSIMPLIIMLPVLNDMIGDYGTIISSRFATMLYEGKVKGWRDSKELKKLFIQILLVAVIMAILSAVISLLISHYSGYDAAGVAVKVIAITLIDVILLVTILFAIAVTAGIYIFKKKEDPNNFLIPITTSIADFGNMVLLAILVLIMF